MTSNVDHLKNQDIQIFNKEKSGLLVMKAEKEKWESDRKQTKEMNNFIEQLRSGHGTPLEGFPFDKVLPLSSNYSNSFPPNPHYWSKWFPLTNHILIITVHNYLSSSFCLIKT